MKKGNVINIVISLVLLNLVLIVPVISAGVDDQIRKLTNYAEDYEIGNIDYIRLLVYISSVRNELNEELGVVDRGEGGVLKQDQIREILGDPTDETRWAWVEREQRERRLSEPVPVWEKTVFDGKKIQMRLNAWPSIYIPRDFYDDDDYYDDDYDDEYFDDDDDGHDDFDDERDRRRDGKERRDRDYENEEDKEEELVYHLNFNIEFKRPEDQLDIEGKIEEIKKLAENFNLNPSRENAEKLAKESVNAERTFENNFRQGSLMCEEIMNDIFGSENKRQTQRTLQQEIDFFQGDDFDVIANLDMCDDCSWRWIGLNIWVNSRYGGGPGEGDEFEDFDRNNERYSNYNSNDFKREIRKVIEEIRASLENGNIKINKYNNRLRQLNDAWSEKSNDVYEEVDYLFKDKYETEEGEDYDPYYWIKLDLERREKEREIIKKNYEDRRSFYEELFSGYDKRVYRYTEEEWEKRLIEIFKERGEEICDNNKDDNDNGLSDCKDPQCAGNFAGKGEVVVEGEGEEVVKKTVELYCIEGERREKEAVEEEEAVCGNHIIDKGETDVIPEGLTEEELELWEEENDYCPEDFRICEKHDPIECDGIVIFSGEDENGCPLEPVCVEEKSCENNDDCRFEFLCGAGECVEGICQLEGLTECRESECVDGEKRFQHCENGNKVPIEICDNGIYKDTGLSCEEGRKEEVCCSEPGPADEPIIGWKRINECNESPEGASFPVKILDDSFCEDGKEKVEEEEKLECAKCGDSCISKDELSVVLCLKTTEDFECVSRGGGCFRDDAIEVKEPEEEEKEVKEEEIVGDECVVRADCGGDNDVCSGGSCVRLPPKVIETEEIEIDLSDIEIGEVEYSGFINSEGLSGEDREEDFSGENGRGDFNGGGEESDGEEGESNGEEDEVTGNVIFRFFMSIPRITGNAISGFGVEGEETDEPVVECPDVGEPPKEIEGCYYEKIYDEANCISGYSEYYCDGDSGDEKDYYEDDYEKDYYEDDGRDYCAGDCDRMCDDRIMNECVRICVFGGGW